MRLRYATAFAFLASAIPAGAAPAQGAPATPAEAPIRLANHRAVYDLSLAKSEGTRAVEAVQGRIVIDFAGDACKGYTIQTRQVTILSSGESGERTSDLRNTTYETGDGKSLRFKTGAVLNNQPSPDVDGTAETSAEGVKVKLKEPKRDQFKVDGTVLFPSHHMLRLIEAARKGETTVAVKVFDGSDDGRKVYDTLAVIGRPSAATPASANTDRDKPLREGEMATMRRWPVTLSYFTQGEGERTPVYTLSFDLYENGVSGAIHLDYGDFAIDGTVSRFDMAKADPKAEGECGK
ncbi:cell envelope integrity EipB family protein [Methylobacterium brachythecii]|uniref:Cell envelope integrity EipB family protein n=1 Tax=Methylobacterium brachythecii TaxID=1176177 RepID=A0A7W6F8C5_9HYPH|nr:cell envelope integrity EipB family protein [Methylobacterium brachythecii]MBB3904323.1 hypothetical protein [Methylobacterium brachythecii]GLS46775.1 hypothetical protein GCM10007884_47720 [Methylobacterium brachythecii]